MSYTSSVFIFFVFAGLLVSAVLPARLRVPWLICLSLGWLASWSLAVPLIVSSLIVANWICIRKRKAWPFAVVSIALLFYFRLFESPLSVGSSFYVLILLAYAMDVIGRKSEEMTFGETFLLGSFFPLMMAGPVEKSDHFRRSLREGRISWDSVTDGLLVFALGFLKINLLSSPLRILADHILTEKGPVMLIAGSFVSILHLYISLSSFADMGRGVARMFGISVPPSFLPVFFARDPADFWERWNRTVASWFRDYLVFPSLLRWGRKVPANFIVFVAFVILGLWHGLEPQWLLFGIFNGLMVILGSTLRKKTSAPWVGRVLVIFLFLGNGLIYVAGRLINDPENGVADFLSSGTPAGYSLPALLISFGGFALVEWFQEAKKENDFFLHWPLIVKRIIAVALLLLWMGLVDHRAPVSPDTLPLYFEL